MSGSTSTSRHAPLALGLLAAAAMLADPAAAQERARPVTVLVGVGASVPTGDLAEATGTGLAVQGGLVWAPGALPVALRADLLLHRHGITDEALADEGPGTEGSVRVLGGTLDLVAPLPGTARLRPYLVGGVGLYDVRVTIEGPSSTGERISVSRSDRNPGVAAGLGVVVGRGRARLLVEARLHNVSTDGNDTRFVPLSVGLVL